MRAPSPLIHPRRLEDRGLAPNSPDVPEGVAHLPHGDVGLRGVDDRRHEIDAVLGRVTFEASETLFHGCRVAAGAQRPDAIHLLLLERPVDGEDLDLLLIGILVAIDADDHALPGFDLGLVPERRVGDLALEEVLLDRGNDPAKLTNASEVIVGLGLEPVGELLQVIRAPERVDGIHNACLVRDHLLRAQSDLHRVLGREGTRLLAGQKGLPFVSLRERSIEPDAARLLSEDQARLFTALPIGFEEGLPIVAVADPTNDVLNRNIREALGQEARFIVVARSELNDVIGEIFGGTYEAAAAAPEPEPQPLRVDTSVPAAEHELPAPEFEAEPEPALEAEPELPAAEFEAEPKPALEADLTSEAAPEQEAGPHFDPSEYAFDTPVQPELEPQPAFEPEPEREAQPEPEPE